MTRRRWLLSSSPLALSALLWLGCQTKSNDVGRVRVACVGDSITFGLKIKKRDRDSYPAQLQQLLGETHTVRNFGLSGTTLSKQGNHPYWTTKPYHGAIEWQPDIVVISLGSNDTKPINWKHRDSIPADLEAMIKNFRNLPSEPEVLVCLPTPAFPERWGIRDEVIRNELIPMIREVAKANGCPVIDLYSALAGKKELFPDKVHPNEDGARLIAKTVHTALQPVTTPTP